MVLFNSKQSVGTNCSNSSVDKLFSVENVQDKKSEDYFDVSVSATAMLSELQTTNWVHRVLKKKSCIIVFYCSQ